MARFILPAQNTDLMDRQTGTFAVVAAIPGEGHNCPKSQQILTAYLFIFTAGRTVVLPSKRPELRCDCAHACHSRSSQSWGYLSPNGYASWRAVMPADWGYTLNSAGHGCDCRPAGKSRQVAANRAIALNITTSRPVCAEGLEVPMVGIAREPVRDQTQHAKQNQYFKHAR